MIKKKLLDVFVIIYYCKNIVNNPKARLFLLGIIIFSFLYSINLSSVHADGEVFFEDAQFERLIRSINNTSQIMIKLNFQLLKTGVLN